LLNINYLWRSQISSYVSAAKAMQYVYFSGLCGYQFASTFQSFALPVEKNSTTQIQKYNYIKYDEQIP
jgi:hypothetical protein